jgi:hypothetical protein
VHPGWFDRLLLILALAYWILLAVALGAFAALFAWDVVQQ